MKLLFNSFGRLVCPLYLCEGVCSSVQVTGRLEECVRAFRFGVTHVSERDLTWYWEVTYALGQSSTHRELMSHSSSTGHDCFVTVGVWGVGTHVESSCWSWPHKLSFSSHSSKHTSSGKMLVFVPLLFKSSESLMIHEVLS